MFMLDQHYFMGFFRKSLNNMRKFWYNLNREQIVNDLVEKVENIDHWSNLTKEVNRSNYINEEFIKTGFILQKPNLILYY